MTNYPIGDFLIRIKNASLAGKKEIEMPVSKSVMAVAKVLKKEGFLEKVSQSKGLLIARLAFQKKKPLLLGIKLVSKPGLRVYWGADELAGKRAPSIFIVSTPKGIISSAEAIKKRVGGEVIVEVW